MFTLSNKKQFLDDDKVNILGILLTVFIVCKYYSNSLFAGTPVPKISMILTIVLSLVLIVNGIKKYNVLHYLLFGFLVIQFILTRNITLIYSYMLALGLINIDIRKIMKTYAIANLIFLIIFIIANTVGIKATEFINGRNDFGFGNPNGAFIAAFLVWISYLYIRFDNIEKKDILFLLATEFINGRNDFGFGNPNGAFIAAFLVWISYLYIRFDNIEKKDILFLLAFPIIVYTQTQTRTGLITVIGVVILLVAFKFIDVRKKWIKIFLASTPFILLGMSLIIAYGFNEHYMLNRVLSHRPLYWYQYLSNTEYGLNLIGYGSNIREIVFNPRLPLDSGYIWGLYSSGIIAFILLMAIYTYAIYQLCNQNKKAEIVLILSIFIYAFAESILLDLGTNITFVFVAYGLFILGNNWRKGKRQI